MDGVITVWVITWRTVWPAMLLAVLVPPCALLARRRVQLAPLPAFALPAVGPLLAVVWSGVFWAAEQQANSVSHWRSSALGLIVLASLALLVFVTVRYRKAPRYWMVVATALVNLVFIVAAGFVGSMAISNTWL